MQEELFSCFNTLWEMEPNGDGCPLGDSSLFQYPMGNGAIADMKEAVLAC